MKRILCTTLPSDDLGLLTRTLPVARELAGMGYEVAYCNPAPAPAKLIGEAGLENLPPKPWPMPSAFAPSTMEVWNLDHFWALVGYLDENFIRPGRHASGQSGFHLVEGAASRRPLTRSGSEQGTFRLQPSLCSQERGTTRWGPDADCGHLGDRSLSGEGRRHPRRADPVAAAGRGVAGLGRRPEPREAACLGVHGDPQLWPGGAMGRFHRPPA